TTTINMVMGILQPTSGAVFVSGIDMAHGRARALAHMNFAAVYAPLPGNLTVAQNLRIFGMLYGVSRLHERIEVLLTQFDLRRFRDTKCGVLSSGEQTRASLAKAMLNRPRLLLLDEPTASLDPATARALRAQIQSFAASGTGGVLWTSHNMAEVEAVCHRIIIVAAGRIVLMGDPKTLAHAHQKSSLEELFIGIARQGAGTDTEAP
ncbi:MAG: ABC transporter ATP-binding protein, partial [Deltaproteobacteria bacterium]